MDHACSIGRTALLSAGPVANSWHPAANAATEQGTAPQKKRNLSTRRGAGLPLPPYRVGRDSAFGSVGDAVVKLQSADGSLPSVLLPPAGLLGRQQQKGGEGSSWREELLGYGARVLALSVYSEK